MDFGEKIFAFALRKARYALSYQTRTRTAQVGADLSTLKTRLSILAQALTGEAIEIQAASAEGGWRGKTFYLPHAYDKLPSREANSQFYIFRICYLAIARALNFNWHDTAIHSAAEAQKAAANVAPLVLSHLRQRYPGLIPVIDGLVAAELSAMPAGKARLTNARLLWGRFFLPLQHTEAAISEYSQLTTTPQNKPATVREANACEEVEVLAVDEQAIEDYTLCHSFEKIETIEEFTGLWRDLDASDDLDLHEEALSETKLKHVVRLDQPVHSIYQLPWRDFASGPDLKSTASDQAGIAYNEWDFTAKCYRPDYCMVYHGQQYKAQGGYAAQVLLEHVAIKQQVLKTLAPLVNRRKILRRQSLGHDLDLDAAVDAFTMIAAGRQPSEHVYCDKRRLLSDISVLIVLDLSLSSDSYCQDQRVFDVERHAAILLADALDDLGIRCQIDGFSSRTRRNCQYTTIKPFDQAWAVCRDRLGAMAPVGYTRIGPALRHGCKLLGRELSQRKLLLLLSDAKPTDHDQYEGRYGLHDVKQATCEAHALGQTVFCLTIEAKATSLTSQMLASNHFALLPNTDALPKALGHLLKLFA